MNDEICNSEYRALSDGGEDMTEMAWVFSETSPFVQLLGKPGRVKILDTLIRHYASKLTVRQITQQAGISESTFSRNKDFLLDLEIILSDKDEGPTRYQINKESDVVRLLVEFHSELIEHADDILGSADTPRNKTTRMALDLIGQKKEQHTDDIMDDIGAFYIGENHA